MYADGHGHVLYLRAGDLAPICPRMGPGLARWALVREIAEVKESEPA
jgi:hypothetical protein